MRILTGNHAKVTYRPSGVELVRHQLPSCLLILDDLFDLALDEIAGCYVCVSVVGDVAESTEHKAETIANVPVFLVYA